jgi:hypothetical protein
MPSANPIRRWCAAAAIVWMAVAIGEFAGAQSPPPFSFDNYQGPIGTGVSSELSRLPPIDEPREAMPPDLSPVESLPPPLPGETWYSSGPAGQAFDYYYGAKARGYYINDQRIEFTGQEATFAVEGVLTGGLAQQHGSWRLALDTELFLNQPYDRNIFQDTPERESFAHNFDIEPFQISQLRLSAQRGALTTTVGRFVTPFGRFYYPLYRNNFDDSPFIRSEAIIYRETGVLFEYRPGIWDLAGALTNGSYEQDTNSSKAFVGRAGINCDWFACGFSIKEQDGIGSEDQKVYKNHVGCDAMVRSGSWTLSAEAITDEYGLRRPGTPLDDIFWGRSVYYRDLNNGYHIPITGIGYYVNLGYDSPRWSLMLNYGEFYPEELGIPQHDAISRRAIVKSTYRWTPNFETYGVIMHENDIPNSFAGRKRQGMYMIFGLQFTL